MKNGILQKFIFSLVLASTVFPLLALPIAAHAEPPTIDESKQGSRSVYNTVSALKPTCGAASILSGIKLNCLVLSVIWLVDKFLSSTFLAVATYLFDISISYSLKDITTSLFVTTGWGIVRDITNLFFIFILLWIALATVFDIPGYGYKDILRRLIIAALLINFSLAIGGFFINLTNALGRSFLGPLGGSACLVGTNLSCGISDKLLAFTNIQVSTTQQLDVAGSAATQQAVCEKAGKPLGKDKNGNLIFGDPETYKSCITHPAIAQNFANEQSADPKIEAAIYQALWLIIMLPILSFVFFAAAIFLLVRYLMLSILLVFAPIVFLFMILPDTRQMWNKWWNNLVQWSFFSPVFFFLLLLTVRTFGALTIANVAQGTDVKGFFGIGFDMILIIVLMIMNLLVAQQMGIYGASTVTGWGNRAAGWVGRQTKGAAYRAAVRGAEPVAKAVTESRVGRFLAQTPGLRALTQPALAIQEQRAKIDEDRAKQIERAAAVSPDLALARLKGENMAVKAAYAKSANPENMRKLMGRMTPQDQESFVADLHANRMKYRIDEGELSKKIGDAMAKDANGLTLRVVAKTGARTPDANFQGEVNKYLDGLTDNELRDAFNAKTISENPHAVDYITKNFRNDHRMGNAILGTPEKIKAFAKLAEAAAEQTSDYQRVKAEIPERQKTGVHLEYLKSVMEKEGNTEGAKALRYSPMINVISGAGVRPFVTEKRKRKRVAAEPAVAQSSPAERPAIIVSPGAGTMTQAEYEARSRARQEGEASERINRERMERTRREEEERNREVHERVRRQREEEERREREREER